MALGAAETGSVAEPAGRVNAGIGPRLRPPYNGPMPAKLAIALSGGVDSALAALLLRDQGHDLVGLFMRSGVGPGAASAVTDLPPCEDDRSAEDARRVAQWLGIELRVVDAADDFARLIAHFVGEYGHGRTPNPCVVCNREIKFGRLLNEARAAGAEALATGHYARIVTGTRDRADGSDVPHLLRGADRTKDQSYALFAIGGEKLPHIRFPLGGLTKAEVRELARRRGAPSHDRPESQDVCFVAGDYLDLIRQRRPELLRPGPIVDETGREVGQHEGIAGVTIGQRKGLRVALGEPRYVVGLDPATATVRLGPNELLFVRDMTVAEVTWLTTEPPPPGVAMRAEVQIRYRHRAAAATITPTGDGGALVRFDAAQRAITPGQAAVFYDGPRVLGGGWIARAGDDAEPGS